MPSDSQSPVRDLKEVLFSEDGSLPSLVVGIIRSESRVHCQLLAVLLSIGQLREPEVQILGCWRLGGRVLYPFFGSSLSRSPSLSTGKSLKGLAPDHLSLRSRPLSSTCRPLCQS